MDSQLEPMDSEANVLRARLSGSHACLNRGLPICHGVKLVAQALKALLNTSKTSLNRFLELHPSLSYVFPQLISGHQPQACQPAQRCGSHTKNGPCGTYSRRSVWSRAVFEWSSGWTRNDVVGG